MSQKRYKLIKWYPSLHALSVGQVVSQAGSQNMYVHKNGSVVHGSEVENNPDFWKELDPLTYEILAFKEVDTGSIFYKLENGNYWFTVTMGGASLDSMLHNGSCVDSGDFLIYAIKRLSDDQVFTIGDYILGTSFNDPRPITKFEQEDNTIIVHEESEIYSSFRGIVMLDSCKKIDTTGFKVLSLEKDQPTGKVTSIKRLRDGEIFTVGDTIEHSDRSQKGKIKSIFLDSRYSGGAGVYFSHSTSSYSLNVIEHSYSQEPKFSEADIINAFEHMEAKYSVDFLEELKQVILRK